MIDLTTPEMKKTREGFGRGLTDLGQRSEDVVVLVGDLTDSTMVSFFAEKFPEHKQAPVGGYRTDKAAGQGIRSRLVANREHGVDLLLAR